MVRFLHWLRGKMVSSRSEACWKMRGTTVGRRDFFFPIFFFTWQYRFDTGDNCQLIVQWIRVRICF